MQKHSGICLFLVAAEFKHNTGGNATLSVNAYLGATLPMSDKQRSFSDLLGKALVGPPHICKEFHKVVLFKPLARNFFHCRRQSCCGLLIWTANCPDLPRFSRSIFFIETLGYWSATKSILLASPACLITALRIRSASAMKRSGILGRIFSCAMASTMTAEAFVRFGRISTPSSRGFARADLFVLDISFSQKMQLKKQIRFS